MFFYSVYFPFVLYRHLLFSPHILLPQIIACFASSSQTLPSPAENLKQSRTQCCHPINIIFWLLCFTGQLNIRGLDLTVRKLQLVCLQSNMTLCFPAVGITKWTHYLCGYTAPGGAYGRLLQFKNRVGLDYFKCSPDMTYAVFGHVRIRGMLCFVNEILSVNLH